MPYRPAPVSSGAAPVPAIEARLEPDANRNGHMIGYQWTVYRRRDGGGPSSWRADQAAGWPPAGEIQVCSSAGDGCLSWGPLYPRDRAGVWDADAAGVSAGVAATAGERQ